MRRFIMIPTMQERVGPIWGTDPLEFHLEFVRRGKLVFTKTFLTPRCQDCGVYAATYVQPGSQLATTCNYCADRSYV